MPAVSPKPLVEAIIGAFEESYHSAVLIGSPRTHPRKFLVEMEDSSPQVVWVYAWTLTFGGRPSLPNEYRIQMTGVESPLTLNPAGPTILIGFEPEYRMFAGFDLAFHRTFTSGSPSVQIDIITVKNALQFGLTFDRKTNDEIAVGIRPDQLYNYVVTAQTLHHLGKQKETFRLLRRAAELEPIVEEEIESLPEVRRRIVQQVSRLSRKANFREQVLHAYGKRCAVTKMQLLLIDATHIIPVGAPLSVDDVTNGLSLSPTYHRAYDNGLIFLDDEYEMKINPIKVHELGSLRLDGGIATFQATLGKIYLPPDRRQWPKKEFIRRANALRMI